MIHMSRADGKNKAPKLPWYKKCTSDWRSGTHHMSFELRGFYSECLDAMWRLQGQLPKDVAKLAMLLAGNPRSVRKLLPQLIAQGKLIETAGGYYNPRMMADILNVDMVPVDGEFAPNSTAIATEFEGNSKGIRAEFDANAPKKPMNSTRVFKNQTQSLDIVDDARAIYLKLAEAGGSALSPISMALHIVSEPLGWIDSGADLDLDIVPVVRAMCAKAKPASIQSWRYFGGAVAKHRDARLQGLPPPQPASDRPARKGMLKPISDEMRARILAL